MQPRSPPFQQFIEHLVYRSAQPLLGLRQTPADSGYCVQMICYVLICRRIEKDGFGLPLYGQHQRLPVFLIRFSSPAELRLNVVM